MAKSRDAFRTISEVAEWLDTPAHVLRFWESKFSQVKPVKRAGGRRYYRPADMALLGGIKKLLHDDGMTIKGAQKVLREKGVKHVTALSQPLDGDEDADFEDAPFTEATQTDDIVVAFPTAEPPAADAAAQTPDLFPQAETAEDAAEPQETVPVFDAGQRFDVADPDEAPLHPETAADDFADQTPDAETPEAATDPLPDQPEPLPDASAEAAAEPEDTDAATALPSFLQEPPAEDVEADPDAPSPALPAFLQDPAPQPAPSAHDAEPQDAAAPDMPADPVAEAEPEAADEPEAIQDPPPEPEPDPEAALDAAAEPASDGTASAEDRPESPLPSFLQEPMTDQEPPETDNMPDPAPRTIPPEPDLDAIRPRPGALSHLARLDSLDAARAEEVAPLAAALRTLYDRMMSAGRDPKA